MNQKLITVALFGAIALPVSAYAGNPNPDASSLDEVVVTATRMPQSLEKTIADTTVFNEQEIRNSAAPDVPTLLRSLAGVEVVQSGGLGNISSTFMRGTNSSHVLVLLDGVRINSATTGTTALEHIMLDSIERIEVVRGNVSSLYGSEAIGGVIQLFTKQGHGAPAFNASAGVGSHGTQRLAAGYAGTVNDTAFSVNAGKVKTDGVSAINPLLVPNANPNNNGYDNNSVNAQIKHALNADHLLSATLFSTRGKSSSDDAYGAPTDLNETQANIDKLSLASDDQISTAWHSSVHLAQGTDESIRYTNGVQTSRFKTRNNQLAWQNNFNIMDKQNLNFAVEHLGQAVSSDTIFTQTTRNVNSVLGGYVGVYGAQQVQINLRQDRYSDFGTANTGLLGYEFSFMNSWRATASISSAFKAPTLNDMFYPFQDYGIYGSYVGNPNLQPERSKNKELGLRYATTSQRIDAVYFDNRIRDLIKSDNLFAGSVINIGQARIDGLELTYAGEFGDMHLKANATWQNSRDTSTGQALQRRAKEFGNLSVSHSFNAWNASVEVRYSGARPDVNYATYTNVSLPGYQLLNLTGGYKIDKHSNLTARVDNLFNRDYSEAYSYNTLGRTLFVGFNYQQ